MQYCATKALDLLDLAARQTEEQVDGMDHGLDPAGHRRRQTPQSALPRLLRCVVALLPVPLDRCLTIEQPP